MQVVSANVVTQQLRRYRQGIEARFVFRIFINEYNGRYTITRVENGFGLDITIPLSEEGL